MNYGLQYINEVLYSTQPLQILRRCLSSASRCWPFCGRIHGLGIRSGLCQTLLHRTRPDSSIDLPHYFKLLDTTCLSTAEAILPMPRSHLRPLGL